MMIRHRLVTTDTAQGTVITTMTDRATPAATYAGGCLTSTEATTTISPGIERFANRESASREASSREARLFLGNLAFLPPSALDAPA